MRNDSLLRTISKKPDHAAIRRALTWNMPDAPGMKGYRRWQQFRGQVLALMQGYLAKAHEAKTLTLDQVHKCASTMAQLNAQNIAVERMIRPEVVEHRHSHVGKVEHTFRVADPVMHELVREALEPSEN